MAVHPHNLWSPTLNHCLGEIAAYDYFKLFTLHACTLMMLGTHSCTDGHRNGLKSHPVWGVSCLFLVHGLAKQYFTLDDSHMMHTMYLGEAKEQGS